MAVIVPLIVLAGLKVAERANMLDDSWDAMMFLFQSGHDDAATWIGSNKALFWEGRKVGFSTAEEIR